MGQYNRSAVIFDIDGTLADCTHRRHLVEMKSFADPAAATTAQKKNWPEFFRLASFDPVVEPVARLLRKLRFTDHIVLCTGREDGPQREQLVKWLTEKGIPYSALFMRPAKDYRTDAIVERELLDEIRKLYEPWLVVDDRNSVVAMWREAGLTCLQCAPGDF